MTKAKTLKEEAEERAALNPPSAETEEEEVITGQPVFDDIPRGTGSAHQAASEETEEDRSNWVYVTVKTDANGQDYLPGQEPRVIQEFHAKLRERQVIADEHAARGKKLQELNEDISSLGRKYRSEFRQSDNKPTVMEYHCGGYLVEVEKTEVEKTTVHKESTKQQTSAAAFSGGKGGKKPTAPGKEEYGTYPLTVGEKLILCYISIFHLHLWKTDKQTYRKSKPAQRHWISFLNTSCLILPSKFLQGVRQW